MALQQLVWTATATNRRVTPVRIEGPQPGSRLFGSLALGQRVGRDGADPRAPVWVSSLVDGQHLAPGHAVIQGDAVMTDRGSVAWRLLGPDGAPIQSGVAPLRRESGGAPRGGERGLWDVSLRLPAPGRYEFEVSQSWPGAQPRTAATPAPADWVDSKTLLVS
jgi:hypothetical protein